MTLGELLPIRLGMLARSPRSRHRAIDEVDRQKALRIGAESLIMTQRVQISDLELKLDAMGPRQAELEERLLQSQKLIEDLTAERDHLFESLAAMRIRFGAQLAADANAHRIDVPPMRRIGCDQDTKSINVTSLWAAADAGLLPGCGPGRLTADSDDAA